MARLIDPVRLIEHPRNTPMFVEIRGQDEFRFKVAWKYDEEFHCVEMIGERVVYDIDTYNQTWRAWDVLPTSYECKAMLWKKAEER